jgi:hypothetical protein
VGAQEGEVNPARGLPGVTQAFARPWSCDTEGEQAMRLIGVLLIVLGIVALCFQSITFFTHERVAEAGPFHIDVTKPHTIFLNPIVGIVAVVAGAFLVLAGRRSSAP